MPSRAELDNRARVVGINPANYSNDSALEQRVLWNEKNSATVTGTLASGTLTSDATAPAANDMVTIGAITYTAVSALTEVAATNTITDGNATNVSDGDIVTIGTQSYRFKTTIAIPGDVHIGSSADASLTNLVSAITGAGTVGTDYATGTPVNTQVTAGAVSAHATTLTALSTGTWGNGLTLTTTAASLTLGSASFSGGVQPVGYQVLIGANAAAFLTNLKAAIAGTTGVGSTFSHGTAPHPGVTGGTLTSTTLVVTATSAATGNALTTTETSAHLSWGAATLTGNVQPIIAANAADNAAISGAALV